MESDSISLTLSKSSSIVDPSDLNSGDLCFTNMKITDLVPRDAKNPKLSPPSPIDHQIISHGQENLLEEFCSSLLVNEEECLKNTTNVSDVSWTSYDGAGEQVGGNTKLIKRSLNEIAHSAGSFVRLLSLPPRNVGSTSHHTFITNGPDHNLEMAKENRRDKDDQNPKMYFSQGKKVKFNIKPESQASEFEEHKVNTVNTYNNIVDKNIYTKDSYNWDHHSGDNISFSDTTPGPTKSRAKSSAKVDDHGGEVVTLEMSCFLNEHHVPKDSRLYRLPAKIGRATDPRSIAERERRIRINVKLKKLQDVVPNIDKQASYAETLELAVKHIKGLEDEIKRIRKHLESCTCRFREKPI